MKFVLVVASFFSLILIVFFMRSIEPKLVTNVEGEIGLVEFKGWVASVNEYNQHFFVTACAKECVTLMVFRGQAEQLKSKTLDLNALRPGQRVSFIGLVDEENIRCLDENCVEVLS